MWLRLAPKYNNAKGSVWLVAMLGLFLFSACINRTDPRRIDRLNELAYAQHYRSLDSVDHYLQAQLRPVMALMTLHYYDGEAERLNNLAFMCIAKMDYKCAERMLSEVAKITDNQVELMVSYVQMMRLCQRRSMNREFYEYREKAVNAQKRINEERDLLDDHLLRRLHYAESEMAIVTSTYYYYVGLEQQSIDALQQVNVDEVRHDTAQYLNYLYNIGAGGILTEGTPEEIRKEEMDCLTRCLSIAQRHRYTFFEAQAREAMAEHTGDLQQAEQALRLFQQYGDVYQIAGAYRTLASCHHALGDDYRALEYLDSALANPLVNQAPDLVASIREQLSVAYAAVNDKPQSDYNRNIYIDLQEQTRQDRELEARAGLLDHAVGQLNWMMLAVILAIVLLCVLLWLFNHQNNRKREGHLLDDELEQKHEEVALAQRDVQNNERRHLEQRAKVSLAMSILPLIDRILYSVSQLESSSTPQKDVADNVEAQPLPDSGRLQLSNPEVEYIRELTDNINEQNDLLTQWIQLRHGELSLRIESFPLQPLFDMVRRSKTSFSMKGVALDVQPTTTVVKADRVLTLFMLNTLADNARKFTPSRGSVSISATETPDYVELSVADTGKGLNKEELAHIFERKIVAGHGFGLMNCKGIIEKYRKLSQLFSVCQLSAESTEGLGARFFFRLPKGVLRSLAIVAGCWLSGMSAYATAQSTSTAARQPLDSAHIYADSAYFCNVNGTYQRTLLYVDSCMQCLNKHYRQHHPTGHLLMTIDGDDNATPPEIQWLHENVETNYQIVLDMRNECAVAALALHEWQLYAYNNKVYTQLFKELSADSSLAEYCRMMQQSQQNKRIAVVLLIVLLVMIVPAYYMLYYRHRLYERFRRERLQQSQIEMADDELHRAELESANLHVANSVLDNCLSTLKHETMYYPSRIRQLVDNGELEQLAEVTAYYRELYGMLIRQAVDQVERIHLHLRPVTLYGQPVLGDENLLHYLFELLKPADVAAEVRDAQYVTFHLKVDTQPEPITSLLCRQIVRDHGEATNRRACGIVADKEQITIILPKYNGQL